MEYKAQLVIRSRDREGVELIEKIKELATDSNRTFSDMALELLTLGVARQSGAAPVEAASAAPSPEVKAASTPDKKPAPKSTSTSKSSKAGPITPKDITKIAKQCAEQIEAEDIRAATQTLAGFFDKAGPIQGGKIKTALEKSLEKADYDELLRHLRKTQEYRGYRQRVIMQL
ncbi:hypothetical protein [Bradymonas sediminis]|uniref:Uncharacterized protein n=1 Tax=Bradymonas sediminis TaxID=1548548 RepID=A0A2Z4FH53_9DELT|nr:hypothetical protein [Bradymonas sediminis]AWV87956.1 hypothetical protein DN745_00870 [Bradymonas sediminis]TDP62976.1 hypothetical protein DFR33_111109 [Bradymonas sediminis]